MKVDVIFDYKNTRATVSNVVAMLTKESEALRAAFNADACYVYAAVGEQVTLVFEYKEIVDPGSTKADEVVEDLTNACAKLRDEFGADAVWVDDAVGE